MKLWTPIILAATLVLVSCQGDDDSGNLPPTVQPSNGTYVHAGSGMEFPERINAFVRGDVFNYNEEATDIGIDYPNNSTGIATSVYIFPSDSPITDSSVPRQAAFEDVKGQVEDTYNETLVEEGQVPLPGRPEAIGWKATYSYKQESTELPLLSDAYLFGFDDWLVEYRFTYAEASATLARSAIEDFMKLLK